MGVRCVIRERWASDSESLHRIFLFFSDRPICSQPPHILSTARDVYGIVCALCAAPVATISVRVVQQNGGGSLLEWVVCICPVPVSLAFRLSTVILFGLGRGYPSEQRPSSSEGQSIFELITANSINNCVHSSRIVRYLELNSSIFFVLRRLLLSLGFMLVWATLLALGLLWWCLSLEFERTLWSGRRIGEGGIVIVSRGSAHHLAAC